MAKKKQYFQADEFGGEFEEKVLFINRCSKVVKGGRKFSFSALVLVGDRKGHVGLGFAKANEVSDAIRKGTEAAKKNVLAFEMSDGTIPHEITVEWDGARVFLKPASEGVGLVAGSKMRSVFELGGIVNIVAKSLGANNPINLVRATFKALESLRNRQEFMANRGRE